MQRSNLLKAQRLLRQRRFVLGLAHVQPLTPRRPIVQFSQSAFEKEQRPSLPHFAQRLDPKSSSAPENKSQQQPPPPPPERIASEDQDKVETWSNPVYDVAKIQTIARTHYTPQDWRDSTALAAVHVLRRGFDVVSRYRGPGGEMTERAWLNRCLFLETVAGVPGMMGGMVRHLRSLRSMQREYGWIHSLLEEAENERMHLMIFLQLKQPGRLMRLAVVGGQAVFCTMFFAAYLLSSRTCHRFVGYLEEEAVKTYTGLLEDISHGYLPDWTHLQAPAIARHYYGLSDTATLQDMITCIRADEANHRDVNHTFAKLDPNRDINPYVRGEQARKTMGRS